MIVITNASGFAANTFIKKLNDEGYNDLVLVNDLKSNSIIAEGKKFSRQVDFSDLLNWIPQNQIHIQFIFHFEQPEFRLSDFTRQLWNRCIEFGLPFVYVRQRNVENEFADWAKAQVRKPYFWIELMCAQQQEGIADVLYFFMHHRKDSGTYQMDSKEGIEKLEKIGFHKIL